MNMTRNTTPFVSKQVSATATLALLALPAPCQQTRIDALLKLEPSDREFALRCCRRLGLLDAADIVMALPSCDLDQAESLLQELARLAPLDIATERNLRNFAAKCPHSLLPAAHLALLTSFVLRGGQDINDRVIARKSDGQSTRSKDIVAHLDQVDNEIASLSLKLSEEHLLAALRRLTTAEACDLTARLLVQLGPLSNDALAALELSLDKFNGNQHFGHRYRLTWIPDILSSSRPGAAAAIKAWAHIACYGSAPERAEAHSQIRRASENLDLAIPYARACLRVCDPLDVRVNDWLTTLASQPSIVKGCLGELGALVTSGSERQRRLAAWLNAIQKP